MKTQTIKKATVAVAALTLTILLTSPSGAEHHHHTAAAQAQTAPGPAGVNPLVEEMLKLDGVFKEIVSGVALGDGEKVHSAIEGMHGTMEKTQEALHTGEIKPPKNADKLHEFERMDKEFHKNLESLAKAAQRNDRKGMLALTKRLMDGCVSCHTTFRK